jgi:glycosyltransferase involved in cell wall biosynthesis
MKRVLLVQFSLNPPGGGNGVAAWIMEGLKTQNRVTLLSWEAPRLETINRYFGTSLRDADFELMLMPRWAHAIAWRTPIPMALIKENYLLARCRRIAAQFDVVIAANNEADLGRRGIQYIHYPKFDVRPGVDLSRFHRLPFVIDIYRWAALHLSGFSLERMRRNLSLVNSDFIGARMRALHGVETTTLYPPVAGDFPAVSWERREDGFVCIGRIAPEKRIEQIIEILSMVRAGGRPVHLHIIGTPERSGYCAWIRNSVDRNRSWITLHQNLTRQELTQLASSNRYGIHAMQDEPFGLAVGEMVRAGCIVFAPNNGGPPEILGRDERLLFGSAREAAEKIQLTVSNPELQAVLRDHLAARGRLFSAEHFMNEMRELVDRFEPENINGASA